MYNKVFQLAQEKGYELSTIYNDYLDGNDAEEQYQIVNDIELTLIQKWLRDEKELSVYCDIPIEIYWRYVVHGTGKRAATYTDSSYNPENKKFNTYEQALLEGIAAALKLI